LPVTIEKQRFLEWYEEQKKQKGKSGKEPDKP